MPKNTLSLAERFITSPAIRWTWSGLSDPDYRLPITEFRPCDKEAAIDMVQGRYLLAARLVDTHSHSPFSIEMADAQWIERLNDFSWLRHFSACDDVNQKEFARVLVLDWIGRNGKFNHHTWSPIITSLRILNWLRHLALLKEGASEKQIKIITRSIGTQVQSLKYRIKFMRDPINVMYSAMALLASALAKNSAPKTVSSRLKGLQSLINEQIDASGLHQSRNSFLQFKLLSELVSLKQTIGQTNHITSDDKEKFAEALKLMHFALESLTLGTSDLAYFNGSKQIATDLFVALKANSQREERKSLIVGDYGVLVSGQSILIADSGKVPPIKFSKQAHASALAFEFSYGNELIIGNCGPAITSQQMTKLEHEENNHFRLGQAHNGAIVNNISSAKIIKSGKYANHLKNNHTLINDNRAIINLQADQETLSITSKNYSKKFALEIERKFSFIDEGKTLVGIDKIRPTSNTQPHGLLELMFHLAPNSILTRNDGDNILDIELKSGARWIFLWEGAEVFIEESLRHSEHFGSLPINKIVLKSDISKNEEISWVFSRQY